MNACQHEANRMSYREAEQVLSDPGAPECLVQAAQWLLAQEPEREEERDEGEA